MLRKPYLLRTPPFETTSGGIRVMWGLYGWLLAKGEIAYVNAKVSTPSVGIYPEIYHGNDMESETVVRYILQTPGLMGTGTETGEFRTGPTEFDKKDKIFVFSQVYNTVEADFNHIMFLPIINLSVFKDQKRSRNKTAYLVGKGSNLNKHPEDSIEITREFAKDQQALADLLNECRVIYVYDRLSAIMDIARLCGCAVKYYGGLPKDILQKYETGMNGLAYEDEIKYLWTMEFREHYKNMIEQFSDRLDYFIEETQK